MSARWITACGLALASEVFGPSRVAGAQDVLLQQMYDSLLRVERLFPLPTPAETVRVGTFDALAGRFSWQSPSVERIAYQTPPAPGHDRTIGAEWLWPALDVDAVHAWLVFEVRNAPGTTVELDVRVTDPYAMGGVPLAHYTASAFATGKIAVVAVNVRDAYGLYWSLRSGVKEYHDKLFIRRPRILGVGAFTIPALPVAIVYAPPRWDQDGKTENVARYVTTQSVGTTTRLSLKTEETPHPTVDISPLTDMASYLQTAASLADNVPQYRAAATALRWLASEDEQAARAVDRSGTTVSRDSALSVVNTLQQGITVHSREGGPGVADVIHYLARPRFMWVADGGRLRAAYLGCERVAAQSVAWLKTQLNGIPDIGLDRAGVQALLSLDPFAAFGPQAPLERYPARFELRRTVDVAGVDLDERAQASTTSSAGSALDTVTIDMPEYHAAWELLLFGRGRGSDPRSTQLVLTHSAATAVTKAQSSEVSVDFYAPLLARHVVEIWYDRAFGTWAFREQPPCGPSVTGVARDAAGRPVSGQPVTLTSGGKTFSTRTDTQGAYSFRACKIGRGTATVTIGNVKTTLQVGPSVRHDIVIPLPR